MIDTENMTFEEASKALIDELNANLATLHQNYHVEQSDWNKLYDQIANVVSEETHLPVFSPEVMEVRPRELECDVVRFQNNKEKWVALVGLLDGHPYEIFTGLQDEDEGIMLPKSVSKGKIVKTILDGGLDDRRRCLESGHLKRSAGWRHEQQQRSDCRRTLAY